MEDKFGGFIMKKITRIILTVLSILIFSGIASATPIPLNLDVDFRDSLLWGGAIGETSWTVGNITAEAIRPSNGYYQGETYHLFHEALDGLGIYNSIGGDSDEIEKWEQLGITINGGAWLTGVWLTDLYWDDDDFDGNEYGRLTINGSIVKDFIADPTKTPANSNGERWVDFGGAIEVDTLLFTGGWGYGQNSWLNEYSVAGFDISPVPEPATIILFGFGLLGLAATSRKR